MSDNQLSKGFAILQNVSPRHDKDIWATIVQFDDLAEAQSRYNEFINDEFNEDMEFILVEEVRNILQRDVVHFDET